MNRLRHPAFVAVALVTAASIVGCGYLLHPERRHATPSRDIDTQVVILDCLWFFAGIAPGVVALAVDFTTGAAYFPAEGTSLAPGDRLMLRQRGQPPADGPVSLRCADAGEGDPTPPALN